MKKVLIVVDMQNDFVTGSLGSKAAQDIVPNIQKKIEAYRFCGNDVIFTRDTHQWNYKETLEGKYLPVEHCIEGTMGWEVIPELEDKELLHINKETFGYQYWEQLEEYESYELCGVCTDICVVSNALALRMFFPNREIMVDTSCCAGTSTEAHEAAIVTMKSCQIQVIL